MFMLFFAGLIVIGVAGYFFFKAEGQEPSKDSPVGQIIDEEVKELMKGGFNGLIPLLGEGYILQEITNKDGKYKVGCRVSRPAAADGVYTQNSRDVAKPGETFETLEILGYVESLKVLPLPYKKKVLFKMVVNRETGAGPQEIQE